MMSRLHFFCIIVIAVMLAVLSADCTAKEGTSSCSLAQWREQGAKISVNSDGSLKAIDLTSAVGLVLNPDDTFSDTDLEAMKSLRVVRGTGYINRGLLQALAKAPRLTEFLWTESSFPAGAFEVLTGHKGLKKLRLSGIKEKDQIASALTLAASLPQLTELDLSRSALNDELLTRVDWVRAFPKLAKLNLYDVPISDRAVTTLLPLAKRLNWLNLDATLISDACMPQLVTFQNLQFLHLGRTSITNASVEYLAGFKKMQTLHVTRTKMNQEGFDKLQQQLPECNVICVVSEDSQKK
ncbi:MAG: hypothetical protein Q4G68_10650 [Planctomycetia bacterium]|nr:hypothetical protein [Planctomycetia bacterium]